MGRAANGVQRRASVRSGFPEDPAQA